MNLNSNLRVLDQEASAFVGLERLPTNTTTKKHAIHRWFNFIAGFSPEFVQASLKTATKVQKGEVCLLDPFSGCGTAPLTARLLEVHAVGYDPHPFFAKIGEAKANSPQYWHELPGIQAAIREGISRKNFDGMHYSTSASTYLDKMFNQKDLVALQSARKTLMDRDLDTHPLAVLILSRMLDYCCFAATDGIYKAPTTRKRSVSPDVALDKVCRTLSEDAFEAQIGSGLVKMHEQSSDQMEELDTNSIDIVVTSPPYLNNFDFAEMTRMYLYFWGLASSWGEITSNVRSQLIVNTTTAIKGHRELQNAYRDSLPIAIRSAADVAVESLAGRRKHKAGKKDYHLIVFPYLSQMQSVLREIGRVMKPGGTFHMMVSDAALYGVHLPAPQWLAMIMKENGFLDVDCEKVRSRGHRWKLEKREGSAQGLGEYYVSAKAG